MSEIPNDLSPKERTLISILFGWSLLHLILFMISKGSRDYFWPFDDEPSLKSDYDFTEFAVYGIVPWVIFGVYRVLNKN